MTTKLCRKCGETKPVEGFHRDRSRKDGLRSSCKECAKAIAAAWHAANPDKGAAWRAANPDKVRAKNAAWRAGGRDPGKPWPEGFIGYKAAHDRVVAIYGPAKNHACRHCDGPATEWAYDYGDPAEYSGPKRDSRSSSNRVVRWSGKPQHYMPLCHPCHVKYDLKREGAA